MKFNVKYVVVHFILFFALFVSISITISHLILSITTFGTNIAVRHLILGSLGILMFAVTINMISFASVAFRDVICHPGNKLENFFAIVLPLVFAVIIGIWGAVI